jgi:hypothetical protein
MTPAHQHEEPIDQAQIKKAVEAFASAELPAVECLIAASEIAMLAAQRFRERAKECREVLGQERARELALTEIADAIARIQDAAAPAVHGYNELLRDSDDDPITTLG